MNRQEELAGKQILVTGGSGFIGRHVVKGLQDSGALVRVLDLNDHPDPSVELIKGDIAERSTVDEAIGRDTHGIVHLAAMTSVLKSVEQPQRSLETNVLGAGNLLEAARLAKVGSLVFATTNAVIGPMRSSTINEDQPLNPLTPYGATKAAAEMLMSAWDSVYGVRSVRVRLTNVYGPGMQSKDTLVPRLMRAATEGADFNIFGDGQMKRDYVHVSDVVAAMLLGLSKEDLRGPLIIGSGSSHTITEMVEIVRKVTGADLRVGHVPPNAGEMPAVIVDNSKARAAGWAPRVSLEEGLAGVWAEWSGSGQGGPPPPSLQ